MSLQPKGENLRAAVKWIDAQQKDDPQSDLSKIIARACVRFNLSPKEAVFLERFSKNP